MKLFPGRIDNPVPPPPLPSPPPPPPVMVLAESMAQAIDDEFGLALKAFKGIDPPLDGADDRKLLFLAIARGVLKYLQQRTDSWLAQPFVASGHTHNVVPNIDLTNPT